MAPSVIGSINLAVRSIARCRVRERATTWISKQAGNFGITLGVLAAARSNTLYVCDDQGDHAYLKTFSLKTSALMKTYELPGGGFCNDIALKGKDAYITDTKGGRVLKLANCRQRRADDLVCQRQVRSPRSTAWCGRATRSTPNTYNGNVM